MGEGGTSEYRLASLQSALHLADVLLADDSLTPDERPEIEKLRQAVITEMCLLRSASPQGKGSGLHVKTFLVSILDVVKRLREPGRGA